MRKTDHVGRKLHSGNEVRTENSSHIPKLTNMCLTERNVSLQWSWLTSVLAGLSA